MLTSLAGRRADKQTAVDRHIAALARETEDAEERLRRLYKLVEDGLAPMDEILKERIASLKATQAAASAALDRARLATRPGMTSLHQSLIASPGSCAMGTPSTQGDSIHHIG